MRIGYQGNFIFFNDAISKKHGFTSIELLKIIQIHG
jgi:hypothetical protein